MGQIHMGRESLFTSLVTCFTADQLPLLREAVDARHCHDEVGVGTLTGAAAAYWPDAKCRGAALAASGGTAPLPPASRDERCRFSIEPPQWGQAPLWWFCRNDSAAVPKRLDL